MEEYICTEVYIPLRKAPSHKAEMGSQILFGEKYCKIDRAGSWSKIKVECNTYSGWVDNSHLKKVKAVNCKNPQVVSFRINAERKEGNSIIIEPGSVIYNLSDDRHIFTAGGLEYRTEEEVQTAPVTGSVEQTAMRFLNVPYLWGGKTLCGMDCSGLTQVSFLLHGIKLPRDSNEQAERGTVVEFITDAIPGDLLFFDNESGVINHVGILLEPGKIIHASGKVRVDKVDHQGIFREDLNKYTHHLRIIRRVTK